MFDAQFIGLRRVLLWIETRDRAVSENQKESWSEGSERELWRELQAGKVRATGVFKGQRVEIPAIEFIDLRPGRFWIEEVYFLNSGIRKVARRCKSNGGNAVSNAPTSGVMWATNAREYLDVRMQVEDVLRLWPPRAEPVGLEAATVAKAPRRRMSDAELKEWIRAKAAEIGRKPPTRTWDKCFELRENGVTKPVFESVLMELYPNSDKGRPRKQKMP